MAKGEGEGEADMDSRIRAILDSELPDEDKRTLLRKALGEGEGEADAEGGFPYDKNPTPKGEGDTVPPSTGDNPPERPGTTQKRPGYKQPGGVKMQGGAQTSPAEINFGIDSTAMPRFNAAAKARFEQAVRTEFWPKLRASFHE